ncbi:MAG: excinuclease ABC subunit UvrA [Candidatus Paceibacterota bacterium]|jgi:excinuclease ABC subunit A
MQDKIIIKGAREHNLKNVNLEIPRGKMTVFTGLSGSGKSSLAFDTIFAEGQRRYIESLSAYARQFLGKLDKPDVDEIDGLSPSISIDQKSHSHNPRSTVATTTEIYDYLRVLFARAGTPFCPTCGREIKKLTNEQIVDAIIEFSHVRGETSDNSKTLKQLVKNSYDSIKIMAPAVRGRKGEYYQMLYDFLNAGFREVRVDGEWYSLKERINLSRYKAHTIELVVDEIPTMSDFSNKENRLRLSEAVESALKYGNELVNIVTGKTELLLSSKFTCPEDNFTFPEIEPRLFSFNSPYGACDVCHGLGTKDVWSDEVCPKCHGKRLREEALNVLIKEKNIVSISEMSINTAFTFFSGMKGTQITEVPIKEIKNRLKFMIDVGLEYLTLDRKSGSLSGGEAQRIRLASQVGSRLTGTLYVLDEPTIGLHQRDNAKLIKTLHDLRDLGNTIIVVEHDEDTIWSSDHLVDFGPAAGIHGGRIIAEGPMPDLIDDKKQTSPTLKYLRGEMKIEVPKRRDIKQGHAYLKIRGAKANNLKNLNVDIPLRRITAVTGVSGSGKSSLVYDVLYKMMRSKDPYHASVASSSDRSVGVQPCHELLGAEYVDRVITIDQAAIGRTPRSNPATYVGAWTFIRDMFASTEDARVRGYKPGRFSFNVPGGRCENCEGHGLIAIEMHFLPTVYVECDVCRGKRFDRETLEVEYKKKNIYQILKMTIEEAEKFFDDIPWLHDKLKILNDVGLGYLELGQPATTLSGGEAQRVKLSAELGKRDTTKTLYLLDEPTTGLHFADIENLLKVLNRLVDRGNTVVVIEHNLDVIKTADWVIDLGPEGGIKGGHVIAKGTPEDIANDSKSETGKYLKKHLKK